MATPIIQSTGSTSGAGTPGESRKDLVIGETVTLSDAALANTLFPHTWAFLDVPPSSSATLTGPTTATPTFSPDVTGSYRVQVTVVDEVGPKTVEAVLAVSLPNTASRIPAFGERKQYNASGNAKGWHTDLVDFMRKVDTFIKIPTPLYNPNLIGDSSGTEVVIATWDIPFDEYPWTSVKIRVLAQALSASGTAVVRLRWGGTGPAVADGTQIATANVTSATLVRVDMSGTLTKPSPGAQYVKLTLQSSANAVDAQAGISTLTITKG